MTDPDVSINMNAGPDEPHPAAKPWKHVGYKHYSRVVASSPNLFYVRQYRALNARIILAMQDQIAELEEELNRLDDSLSQATAPDIHNGSFRQEVSRERAQLIWEIQRKLRSYSN
jgi:sugar-specific transcriptional regulator TrmB